MDLVAQRLLRRDRTDDVGRGCGLARVLSAPADGKVAWPTHDDLAAAAAAVLGVPGRFEGPTPPLTGSEALDLADVASLLSDIHRRPIHRQVVADEAWVSSMRADGIPAGGIEIALEMYRAARAGDFSATDATLATLVGTPPTGLSTVLSR